jgi:hypothetical protein
MRNRSSRLFGGTVRTRHAIRVNHTEIRCHTHDAGFSFQQNRAFVGRVSEAKDGAIMFGAERVLGTWSLAGGKLATTFDLLFRKRRRLRPRLKAEAARRGQAVPKVRFPGEERRSRSPRVVDQEPSGPGPLGSH